MGKGKPMNEPAAADGPPAPTLATAAAPVPTVQPADLPTNQPADKGALGAWWAQGVRAAAFMPVAWVGLKLSPGLLISLWLMPQVLSIGLERLGIPGKADFYWPALLAVGWMEVVAAALVCWFLAGRSPTALAEQPSPTQLFAMWAATLLPLTVLFGLALLPWLRDGSFMESHEQQPLAQAVWLAGSAWFFGAQAVLLWRASRQGRGMTMAAIGALLAIGLALQGYLPLRHWYPSPAPEAKDAQPPSFKLTQEVMEAQGAVLQRGLAALAPQKRGRTDVFAITFAPDATEDVFQRESALVAEIMSTRFGAAQRTVQLVSRFEAQPSKAWATPLNLQRTIAAMARLMDREEDLLVIHLTSHGARNGELAASLWPLDVAALTPQQLKGWLDAAGIRHRVISVSACYSGSWIAPLRGDSTLVMTAADSDHTSYGCGRGSELTYFGRAVFGEQLRQTRSFEQAHAAAREVIREREIKAKKEDGFSNPQIDVGDAARRKLAELVRQLELGS
jgi:Peptidase C13 family